MSLAATSPRWSSAAGALHDVLTRAGFAVGCAALAVIFAAYNVEVVLRYVFNAPTTWSADLVNYALCLSIFLVFPDVTRRSGHVAITSLIERLSAPRLRLVSRWIAGAGALMCATTAVIFAGEGLTQGAQGIETVAAFAIPKWWLTAVIAYGFANSALHLARLSFARDLAGTGIELPT